MGFFGRMPSCDLLPGRAAMQTVYVFPSRARKRVASFFGAYGRAVYKRPWLPIVVSLVGSAICWSGIPLVETEVDAVKLFGVSNGWSYGNFEITQMAFGDTVERSAVFVSWRETGQIGDFIAAMKAALALHQTIIETKADTGEDWRTWCVRPNSSLPCRPTVFLALGWRTEDAIDRSIRNGTGETELNRLKALSPVSGGHRCMRIVYDYQSKGDMESFEKWKHDWEKKVMNVVVSHRNVVFSNVALLNEMVIMVATDKLSSGEVPLMSVAFAGIFVVVFFTITGRPLANTRVFLVLAAVASVFLSMGCAYGLAGHLGVKNTATTILLVFVLLGIGVDDVIIIVHHVDGSSCVDLADRMAEGLSTSGLTITITSLTSAVGFAAATQVSMGIVRNFCIVGIFGIIADYLLQLSFFVGIFVYDERRRCAGLVDCICCISAPTCPEDIVSDFVGNKDQQHETKTVANQLRQCRVGACFRWWGRQLTSPVGIVLSTLSWLAILVGSTSQLQYVSTQFDLKLYYPKDSPVTNALVMQETFFPLENSDLYLVLDHRNVGERFFDERELAAIDGTSEAVLALGSWTHPPAEAWEAFDWTRGFRRWRQFHAMKGAASSSQSFKHELAAFLAAPEFPARDDVACPPLCVQPGFFRDHLSLNKAGVLEWSRIGLLSTWPPSSADRILQMKSAREAVEGNVALHDAGLKMFPFDHRFIHSERDDRILDMLLVSLASTCAVIAGMLMILVGPLVGIFVGTCIGLLDLSLLGLLVGAGWHLDTVVFLNISMVVGMCVDYIVHAVQSISQHLRSGMEPRESIMTSFEVVGRCVFEGALSTMLGLILPACFAKSRAAKNFGTTLTSAIVLGAAYGLIWAPTFLFLAASAHKRLRSALSGAELGSAAAATSTC
eukprot:TRINITY_DN26711_c0_g1_i1.p1 TRINITY_DN26711_c0_g1~~TRINITY_DN26711_c0_g1_i1.p1  ORF type:complete len:896 (+),score=89.74 TRINITY_DN26711_c0_g1_i1:1-2688(+)